MLKFLNISYSGIGSGNGVSEHHFTTVSYRQVSNIRRTYLGK